MQIFYVQLIAGVGCFSFGNTEKDILDVNLQLLLLNYVAQKIDSVMPSLFSLLSQYHV